MKYQIIITVVCCVLTEQVPIKDVPEVDITAVRGLVNPPRLKVEWHPIKNDNRILGYRAKAWEVPEHEKVIHREINGTFVPVVSKTFDIKILDTIPTRKPDLEIEVPSPLGDSATFELKVDQYYQISVLAYTKDGEEPLADPHAVQIPKS